MSCVSNQRGEEVCEGGKQRTTAYKVLTFYANIIGYARVVLLIASMLLASVHWKAHLACYTLSFLLDVVDGPVARHFNQASRFGAALDLMTDKLTTASLMVSVATQLEGLPAKIMLAAAMLDAVSHYFHMYATLLTGGASHKSTLETQNFAVRTFYAHKALFAWTCLGHELFLIALYAALQGSERQPVYAALTLLCFPSFVWKTVVHVAQLASACYRVAEHDAAAHNECNY